jgi:hypothetical protein
MRADLKAGLLTLFRPVWSGEGGYTAAAGFLLRRLVDHGCDTDDVLLVCIDEALSMAEDFEHN